MLNSPIFFSGDLTLKIYTINYKSEGESIIFLIEDDNGPLFCGVVDCFEYKKKNKTIELLKQKGVKRIDFLCWTHTDKDHSIGIDKIVKKYVTKDTLVILPEYIDCREDEFINYNKRIKATFALINDLILDRKVIFNSGSRNKILLKKDLTNGLTTLPISITSLSPDSAIVRRRVLKEKYYHKNDFSVALKIEIGNRILLLTSDIEDITSQQIESYSIPNRIDFLKIPHHSSKGVTKLLDYINDDCEISCTTIYKK